MDQEPPFIIDKNNKIRLKQKYILSYSFDEGFTEHLFHFSLLVENSGKTLMVYSGFQLEEKHQILEEIPQLVWNFFEYIEENQLPFSEYYFDTGLCINDIGGQQLLLNWNKKSYFISMEGNTEIYINNGNDWKHQIITLLKFLEKIAYQKRKQLLL